MKKKKKKNLIEIDDDLKITVSPASNKYFHRISVKTCVTSKNFKNNYQSKINLSNQGRIQELSFHDGEQNLQSDRISKHNQRIDS